MLYDKDIREPLFEFLEETYGKIRIIEEKRIGKSRADVMMIQENMLTGIEIKSDADNYTRLDRQIKDYNLYFDQNMVVVGSTHAAHIAEHVPEWWGIVTVERVEERVDFYIFQEMKPNPSSRRKDGVPPIYYRKRQLSFLWRPELAHIQENNHMYKYAQKSKAFVIDKILEVVPAEQLKAQICEELFERDYTQISKVIDEYRKARGDKPKKRRKKARKHNMDSL